MSTKNEERYWDRAALDPDVDDKYICDIPNGEFFQILRPLKGRVLEIGCGVGRLMKPGYYGIDISKKMLDIARVRNPRCEFVHTDGRTIPYPDAFFDGVYSVLVFQHIPLEAVNGYIKEAYRVLKKGGMFIFQYIEGDEDAPFSKHHVPTIEEFKTFERKDGLIHPQWTWITATK